MGGKDVIHIKQLQKSNLQPTEVQTLLKQLADERFSEDVNGGQLSNPNNSSGIPKVQQDAALRSICTISSSDIYSCVCRLRILLPEANRN